MGLPDVITGDGPTRREFDQGFPFFFLYLTILKHPVQQSTVSKYGGLFVLRWEVRLHSCEQLLEIRRWFSLALAKVVPWQQLHRRFRDVGPRDWRPLGDL